MTDCVALGPCLIGGIVYKVGDRSERRLVSFCLSSDHSGRDATHTIHTHTYTHWQQNQLSVTHTNAHTHTHEHAHTRTHAHAYGPTLRPSNRLSTIHKRTRPITLGVCAFGDPVLGERAFTARLAHSGNVRPAERPLSVRGKRKGTAYHVAIDGWLFVFFNLSPWMGPGREAFFTWQGTRAACCLLFRGGGGCCCLFTRAVTIVQNGFVINGYLTKGLLNG